MIKKLLCVLLTILTLFSLSACHGSKGLAEFSLPEDFDESKTYEIAFWAKNDTNRSQVDIYEKAISDFENLYPNIHVSIRLYTNYVDIYNDVITNIATQTTPNVCITYPDHIATYLTGSNTVVPLEGLFASPKYGLGGSAVRFDSPRQDEIIQEFLDEGEFDGHYYALPFMRSTEACYINRTFVERLGYDLPEKLSWDFIWEVSEAAMVKDEAGNFKVNGQKVMIPFIYKSTDNMMIQMLRQKNAPYSNEDGSIEIFNDTAKELLFEIAKHAGSRAFSTFKISSYPANFLNAGQCIFAIDSTAGSTWMGSKAPLVDIAQDKLVEFETAVKVIPQFDIENPVMISQGPSVCIFNKADNQEVLASWLFAQFLLTNEVQTAYAETEGYVPVTHKAQNSPEYREYLSLGGTDDKKYYDIKIKATELLIANTSNTFTTPVFNGSASLRDAAGQMIENVTKSMRRKEVVDDAYMNKMFSDVTALYRLGQANVNAAGKKDFGPLPKASVVLLTLLGAAWICIAVYAILKYNKSVSNRDKK